MGFFDSFKVDSIGRKAVKAHGEGNDKCKCGKPHEAEKYFDEALKLYEEAYGAGCRRPNILTSYAVLLMRRGMFTQARELMKVISKETKLSEEQHFELRVNYAVCLWHLGLLDEAINTMQYAGKYAKNGSYYTTMGSFIVEKAQQTGSFEDAKAFLDEAMEYDDEDAATLDNYGDYYRMLSEKAMKEGDADASAAHRATAKEYYVKANKIRPGQITTLYHLAMYAREDGDIKTARELVDKAIARSNTRVCAVSIETLRQFKAELA